ncbi:MAG: fimbrial protein [Acidovorax sp.]|nr:fimbrial protein [Acidovorax sp.]
MIGTTSHAQTSACRKLDNISIKGWTMQPSGIEFQDGQIIGTTQGWIMYSLSRRSTVQVDGKSWNIPSNKYGVVNLPKTPGVGIRIKWAGYWVHADYKLEILNLRPNGDVLSQNFNRNLIKGRSNAESQGEWVISFYYDYEIVVTDSKKYKGGPLIIESDANVFANTSHSIGSNSPALCNGGALDLLGALRDKTGEPELPKPPVPTCAAADLDHVAKMKPVTSSQIAAHGSDRGSGALGEYNFILAGRKCQQGTTIKAYFTDNKDYSSNKTYLKSSHPDIGVRIYHRQNQIPIEFGPAPLGSTLPSRAAIIEGPSMSEATDMLIPFTAQYVRIPTVSAGNVRPGEMKAAATVTFIYD